MAKYLVEMPFKCVQFFEVKADSAADAKRLAADGEGEQVEAIDWRVIKHYRPISAKKISEATHA